MPRFLSLSFLVITSLIVALAGSASAQSKNASAQSKKQATPTPYLHAPSVESYAQFNPEGRTVMTTGRYLKPVGSHIPVAIWPHGLVLSPDGKTAFVASDGVGQLISGWQSGMPTVTTLTPEKPKEKKRRLNTGAVAFSADGKTLYWGGGDASGVQVFDVETRKLIKQLSVNVPVIASAYG